MPTLNDRKYRRLLIARVEALRTEASIPMLRFRQQLGPVAAREWANFVKASDEDVWDHFSLKAVGRIATLFGVGAELLQAGSRSGRG